MGFPTEQEIYHRLRWDPRFDANRCSIVIRLRPSGTQRIPLPDFDSRSIPWHLVTEFWVDDELAWSRPARIDRLDELAARAEPGTIATPLERGSPLAIWRGEAFAPPTSTTSLRVVTWNLLFDRFDAERLRSALRWQDALDRLATVDADIIVLVEVTSAMWRLVLAQPWIQRYMASHAADAELAPYGQTVLARRPIAHARSVPLDGGKRATFVTLEDGARRIGVAAVHLTSNRKPDAMAVRRTQLARVDACIREQPRDAWIIAGDFNAPPDEHADALAEYSDAWSVTRPDDAGYTFDVARNELAAAATTTGRSARMDRIHVRGLRPRASELFGDTRGPCGLPPSDHYAVVADLVPEVDLAVVPTSPRSALAIVPPLSAWGPLQRIRCEDDRNWLTWPPHVTLFHPFVAAAYLDEAIAAVADIAARHEPFELELDRVETIDERGQTVVLAPRNVRAVARLHAALAAALPAVAKQRSFRPHLTIGRTGRRVELAARWHVDELVVLQRADEVSPFAPVAAIALGRNAVTPVAPPPDRVLHHDVIERVRATVDVPVAAFGSAIYAPAHASDLDLLVRGDQTHIDQLVSTFDLAPAGVGRLRGEIDSVPVDVIVTDEPRLVASAADATLLRDHLRGHGRHEAFAAAWPHVRAFVHARGLRHNGLGFFSSIGWALLLAVPLVHDETLCAVPPPDVFPAWLDWLTQLRPHARIGLDAIRHDDPAQLYLAAPAPPSRDIARHMTPGTLRTLFAELRRPTLLDLRDDPPAGAVLVVRGRDRSSRGRYDGMALSLIRDLETRVGAIRVWGRFEVEPGGTWTQRITVPSDRAGDALAIATAILSGDLRVAIET